MPDQEKLLRVENTERRPASRLLKTIVGPRNTGLEKVTDGSSRTRRLFKKNVLFVCGLSGSSGFSG